MPRSSLLLGIALCLSLATACSASSSGGANNGGDAGNNNQGGGGFGGGQGGAGAGDLGGGFASGVGGGNGGSTAANCNTPAGFDDDGDGFSEDDGDCNDCDANVNPGAIEVYGVGMNGMPAEVSDEDCDGTADNVVESCDETIALDDADPYAGARAIELCQKATPGDKKWGVLSAQYVRADGSSNPPPNPLQWGIKPSFGNNVNVQRGKKLLALSAGYARDANDADGCATTSCYSNFGGIAPPGFPQDVPNCSGSTSINDDVALDLKIRAPTNATGYSFKFKFYSFEFPEWICTSFNDQFIALVNPAPQGSINGNISFDSKTNPVSVNIAFFDVCDPASISIWAADCFGGCPPPPNPYCPSGIGELQGTGFLEWDSFSYAGGTSWLQTQAPIKGGQEFSIRFAIWDTGDQALDSTAVIDDFQWIANGGTVTIGTEEIPDPK